MENIKDSGQFETLELKANLNPEQRDHLELLKDKMRKILGGKTKQELARAGNLEALKKYKAVLESILEFLRTKEIISDDELIKRKQIKKIEGIIMALSDKSKIIFDPEAELKSQLKRLAEQIEEIKTPVSDKINRYDEDVKVTSREFKIKQIFGVIANVKQLDADDLFLSSASLDDDGNIVTIWIGVAGVISSVYFYTAAFQNVDAEGKLHLDKKHLFPKIEKYYVDLDTGDRVFPDDYFAYWVEAKDGWFNKSGEEINV